MMLTKLRHAAIFSPRIADSLCLGAASMAASATPTTILLVGNSYTYGEGGASGPTVKAFMPGSVTDLNGTGVGGVPALFKAFTQEAGLGTVDGKVLNYH